MTLPLVTLAMVERWQQLAKLSLTPRLFQEVLHKFGAPKETRKASKFQVTDSAVSDALITFYIRKLSATSGSWLFRKAPKDSSRILQLSNSPLGEGSSWRSGAYQCSVIQLLACMAKATITAAVFQHVSSSMLYYLTFPKQCHMLLKRTVVLWSTGEQTL